MVTPLCTEAGPSLWHLHVVGLQPLDHLFGRVHGVHINLSTDPCWQELDGDRLIRGNAQPFDDALIDIPRLAQPPSLDFCLDLEAIGHRVTRCLDDSNSRIMVAIAATLIGCAGRIRWKGLPHDRDSIASLNTVDLAFKQSSIAKAPLNLVRMLIHIREEKDCIIPYVGMI